MNIKKYITLIAIILALFIIFNTAHVFAQSNNGNVANSELNMANLPSELMPWVNFIKLQNPEWDCSSNSAEHVCLWPGQISYSIFPNRAQFIIDVEVLKNKMEVPLPSSANLFPSNIKVLNENAEIVKLVLNKKDAKIFITLSRGKYKISGEFNWKSIPPEIPIPIEYALVDIKTDGVLSDMLFERIRDKLIASKKVELNERANSVDLEVMRKVIDGSPLEVITLLKLKISGAARPINLGQVVPKNSSPVSIDSKLPHYLSSEGNLALQVVPGEYDISISSLLPQPVNLIELPSLSSNKLWPNEEVWSLFFNNSFRSVEIVGATPIHADATKIPQDWRKGSVYIIKSGASITLKELRRAFDGNSSNNLTLNRNIWVDIYDKGATVEDVFYGSIKKDFRLNALDETKLGRALVEEVPQLVTKDPNNNKWGVELRNTNINLKAVSRYDNAKDIPAIGWDTKVQSIRGTINLPPSWVLVSILGANTAKSAWLDSWTLLEIFLSVLIVLAVKRLLDFKLFILIAAALVLNHREFLAPEMLFIHLLLLIVWRNLISVKDSIWQRICDVLLVATFSVFFVECLTYAKLQFTQLLFPQLQSGTRYRSLFQEILLAIEGSPFIWPAILFYAGLFTAWIINMFKSIGFGRKILTTIGFICVAFVVAPFVGVIINSFSVVGSGGYSASSDDNDLSMQTISQYGDSNTPIYGEDSIGEDSIGTLREDSGKNNKDSFNRLRSGKSFEAQSNLQTQTNMQQNQLSLASGYALPTWRWKRHNFSVNGPVPIDHRIKFLVLTPTINRTLSGIRVFLILSILFLLLKKLYPNGAELSRVVKYLNFKHSIIILGLFSIQVRNANAEMPPEYIFNKLQNIVQSDYCKKAAQCAVEEKAVIDRAKLEFKDSAFVLTLNIVSDGVSIITVPGPLDVLTPSNVLLNGKKHIGLRQNGNGFLEIRTEAGSNLVEIIGNLPKHKAFSLLFPDKPLYVQVDVPNWFVEGIESSGFVPDAIRFTSIGQSNTSIDMQSATQNSSSLSNWVKVEREINIDESIDVVTKLIRIGDVSRELHVSLPLLPNERVTSGNIKLESNKSVISFPSQIKEVSFNSNLPMASELKIVALSQSNLSEQWKILCQPNVSCKFSGILETQWSVQGRVERVFDPFPGESVNIGIIKLDSISGEYITVDKFVHKVQWGERLLNGDIYLNTRVTQQSPLVIRFPVDAVLLETKIKGMVVSPINEGKGQYKIMLLPGMDNVYFKYEKDFSSSLFEKTPSISLNVPANNITINVAPSNKRWVLWVGGPAWGPSVVYWAKVIAVIFICLTFSRLSIWPISLSGAVLFGIGLSSLKVIYFGIPIVWLVLLKLLLKDRELISNIPKIISVSCFITITLCGLTALYVIVHNGLMIGPPMLIVGNNSDANMLNWYIDRTKDVIAQPWIVSLPLYCWRIFSLVWAIWLVMQLFNWLRMSVDVVKQLLTDNAKESESI